MSIHLEKTICVISVFALAVFAGCSTGKPAANEEAATANSGKLLPNPLTVKIMQSEHPSQPLLTNTPIIREVFNKTNVQVVLQPVPASSYEDKKNVLIATNDIPDVIRVSKKDLHEFGRTGMFLNISDYLQYAPNFKALIDTRPEFQKNLVDGKIYGFPVLENWRMSVAFQPLIRKDALEMLNLQAPKTFDELYEVLKKFKAAYPDKIPMTTRNGTLYMLGQLTYPMGTGGYTKAGSKSGVYFEPSDKQYVYGPASAEFKKLLEYMNKLYMEKLLDPDYATNTQQMFIEKLSSGRAFFYYDNSTFSEDINNALKNKEPNAQMILLDPLQNSKGQARSYRGAKDWLDFNFAVSSRVKDPVGIVKFYDWMYSKEGVLSTNFGALNETYEIVNGEPKYKSSLLDKHKDKPNYVFSLRSEIGSGLNAISVNIDESLYKVTNSKLVLDMAERIDKNTGTSVDFMLEDPPFTKAEITSLSKLEVQLNTMVEQEMDKFIMGVRPLSEYDNFREELIKKGAKDIEKIYNDAYAKLKK
ncbi:extracellular solute-binding protein [Paenibacillus radicis (ex Xue et al. 2023)]|uniref:Extracellular solute-binding protein n=1 Tax=Paenibacillus radicis (ex Xue et al. 2023) TaxID=2972489 RepID=A0ABT1YDI9_9BACL|nr:extracellular solute-binding protein [Paenibacillus radicis (ex Xue et al. 2023)]MCR8630030.1 extracellular solute-binding protein [Paenibacillus radicis (ex Xue et al. 2023)]